MRLASSAATVNVVMARPISRRASVIGLPDSEDRQRAKSSLRAVISAAIFCSAADRAGAEDPLLAADLERPLPLEHDVDLVLIAVDVALLGLSRLEAVDVTKEPRRLKQVILLHLVRRELLEVVQRQHRHD